MDQTWRLFLINLAKDEEPCGLSVLGDSTPYQIYSVFYLQKRSINAEFYLMKDPVKVQNKIILSKHLIINQSQTIINQQYTLTIRFIIKMNIIDNTKSPMLDTAGRTQSYHYDNPNDSPPESVSFRQNASPSQLNPFTNIKDQPYNSYIGRSHIQSHHEPYTTLTSSLPQGLKSHLTDDLDQLILQQRIQVESLYLQIGRLTQELHLSQQLKAIQCKKIRQQCQQIMYKQASQLRQNHQNQVQVFELQIRKMKEQINDKNDETKRLHELLQRQKQSKQIQKNRFNEEVRMLIEKKYSEVFQQKQVGQTKLREFEQNKKSEVEELQYTFNKEIRNLNKMLEQRQEEVQRIRLTTERQQRQKMKQIQYLQSQLEIIQKRNELRLSQEYQKYDKVRTKFNQLIMQFSEIGQKSRTELHQLFQQQYNQLVSMLKAKSAENEQIKQQIKAQIQVYSKEIEAVREQNYALQKKINQKAHNAAEDMELLKVKLASLHQNDVKQIKQLYELKLKNLSGNLYRMDEQNSKLREMTNLLSAEKYQQKKAFQITISQLNSKILKFRMGMTSMESDYRQKMQNQKSLMLMTSKTFLKDAQAKNVSHKFLEEQIRKLRQLMDLQSRQNQNSQKVVQQRILAANYELQQLSNRVLSIAKEKKQLQQELSELRRQKDEEISRLRSQLNIFQVQQTGQIPELKIIQEQRHQILKHKEEIGILKDKLLSLESRMKQMKQVSERLQMENSIHLDQAKKQYHIIAEQHLKDFKSYYQEKMRVAQEQKTQLKKIISSQTEKITELIKKYKETEQGLREATRLMKKRTQLQQKVMNIGLDVNLVKNLAQLLPNPKNQ